MVRMRSNAAEYYIEKIQSLNLYNKEIENYFTNHFIYKNVYYRKELLNKQINFSEEAAVFVRAGRFKIYTGTIDGDNVFIG